jgi:hypothetical protein
MIYVSLKEKLMGEDEHKKLMATQMISKFEKYWFEFNEALGHRSYLRSLLQASSYKLLLYEDL